MCHFIAYDWNHEHLVAIVAFGCDVVEPWERGSGDMEGAQHAEDGKKLGPGVGEVHVWAPLAEKLHKLHWIKGLAMVNWMFGSCVD